MQDEEKVMIREFEWKSPCFLNSTKPYEFLHGVEKLFLEVEVINEFSATVRSHGCGDGEVYYSVKVEGVAFYVTTELMDKIYGTLSNLWMSNSGIDIEASEAAENIVKSLIGE